jgi:tRNA pseudouridine55 synthase
MLPVSRSELQAALDAMVGEQWQTPPKYSALKIAGKRAYRLARKNREFSIPPRPITLHQLRLLDFQYPRWEVEIVCSKGTYVRTVGHDLGIRLGGGAVMTHLTRTRVAMFSIQDAWRETEFTKESVQQHLVPPQCLFADLPILTMCASTIDDLRCGRRVQWQSDHNDLQLQDEQGRFLGLLRRQADGQLRYEIHFANYFAELDRSQSLSASH